MEAPCREGAGDKVESCHDVLARGGRKKKTPRLDRQIAKIAGSRRMSDSLALKIPPREDARFGPLRAELETNIRSN